MIEDRSKAKQLGRIPVLLFFVAARLAQGQPSPQPFLFEDVSARLAHKHLENEFDDFATQLLLPNRLSRFGPGLAWCDMNGDGRDDLLVGSGTGGFLTTLLSLPTGDFRPVKTKDFAAPADFTGIVVWHSANGAIHLFAGIANFEDQDVDRESVRSWEMAATEGKRDAAAPGGVSSTGPIAFADIDGDGDLDLFVGGRVIAGRYPAPASSRILKREADHFVADETNTAALNEVGLVSGAVFSDLNGDGFPDLVLALEWGPVKVFMNDGKGRLTDETEKMGLAEYSGWWNGVTTGDLDGDGRMDIVATNWGLNSKYQTSRAHPLLIYYGEFESPGRLDIVEAHFDQDMGKIVPERGFTASAMAMPFLKQRVQTHKQFAQASVEELYGDKLNAAKKVSAKTLEHMVFFNRGAHFEAKRLPVEAQFAPGFGVSVADFDGDGAEDIAMTQNFFAAQIETPRCDAGRSLLLRGNGKGELRPVPGQESGILVYGDARGLAVGDFDADGRPDLAIGQNGAATKLFHNIGGNRCLRVVLHGPEHNPPAFGAQLRLQFGKRFGPMREVHGGSGFWSQDSATVLLGMGPEKPTGVWVRWPGGKVTTKAVRENFETATIEFPN